MNHVSAINNNVNDNNIFLIDISFWIEFLNLKNKFVVANHDKDSFQK